CMARDKKLAKAEAAAKEADAVAKDAQDKVNKLTKELADVDAKIAAGSAAAPDAGVGSGSGSSKPKGKPAAGSATEDPLRKQKADLETRLAAAKAVAAKAQKAKEQTAECAKNPSAKGC